ncbi:MAG: spermidine/putrescine ABC transporter substrate-binding protein [Elusimicrobiota bacterium]|jgi:spermidine/putrescine-binding protein|nr:spermidine/putrescine ABC transporter substrate-binding protein [Elusimicrobiota bacterium]
MKKMSVVVCLFLIVFVSAFAFIGCSKSTEQGEVNLFIWTEYMPESVIRDFEKETGIKVNVATYSSNEDLLAKVKGSNSGIYDIVVPSDYMIKMMVEEGLLEELDAPSLSNFKNIDPAYINRDFDPQNKFSVPFMAGAAALIINNTKVSEKITSFAQLSSPKYENAIVVLDDYRAVIGAVAKALGYSFNATSDTQLAKIDVAVQALKPNIKLRDSDSPKTAMLNGETIIGYMWSAEIAIAMQEDPTSFSIVFPTEGCYLFIDNMAILKGAKNVENAKKFIDYILRAEVSKKISEEYPYTNPNKAAVALLPDSYRNNPASNVPAEIFAKGEFIKDIGSKVEQYDLIWTKFTK